MSADQPSDDVISEDLAEDDEHHTASGEVFSPYLHRPSLLPGCQPHPGSVVEASSLAALSLPPPTYPLADSIPQCTVLEGKLSSLQLEGVLYTCQRHQLTLSGGQRAGFFLGDAAGVGKGRQIAGVILDNFARGRTKHLWFSVSNDLIVDARRDLGDIGCHVKVIDGCQQLDKETKVFGLPADFKHGVVFSTYSTLVSSVSKPGAFNSGKQTRLDQLVAWCGGSQFDGCLVFDECHKAKHFIPGKESSSTQVALAVTRLQRLLPAARVLYCSATGVSDVKNMAFMERLGLWGPGAAFSGFDQFMETVQRKGLGVAEMLAMEMKTSGMYLCRSLSFHDATFSSLEVELTKEQRKMYDMTAHVWSEVKRSLTAALDRTGSGTGRVWVNFWGAHQRFFRQLCLGVKVPAVVSEVRRALDDGCCVVIGLQTTGEASVECEKQSAPLTSWVSVCRQILTRFIQQHFPTTVEKKTGGQTNGQTTQQDDWCVTAKQMLEGFAQQIKLPNSPLDELVDQLGGPGAVAEMTGRRGRMVRHDPRHPPEYQPRDTEPSALDNLNVRERNEFMSGRKLVAIISDAASTGISLHADERATNQRRRVHITMELPWSADKAVQQLGRSHRANQSSGPVYKLMTTSLGGERRFAAAVAKRLEALGALTRGDRRAATGADLTQFNCDTPYGRAALRVMYCSVCQSTDPPEVDLADLCGDDPTQFYADMMTSLSLMGVAEVEAGVMKVKDTDSRDVPKFLNRILGLSVARQNKMFTFFSRCLDAQVTMAKKEGRYKEGVVDLTAASIRLLSPPRVLAHSRCSNNPSRHAVLVVDRGLSWERAVQRLEHNPGPDSGFYRSRRAVYGQHLLLLATARPGSTHSLHIARPNTGLSAVEESRADLLHKYSPVDADTAEEGWRRLYEESRERCMHGAHCKAPANTCSVGARCYRLHLLCGGTVTMMSLLEQTLAAHATRLSLTRAERSLRVVRVELDSGERLIGVRYPEALLSALEEALAQDARQQAFLRPPEAPPSQNGLASSQTTSSTDTQTDVQADEQTDGEPAQAVPLTEEPVTAVNTRWLLKATTPPPTITSFFKVTSQTDTPHTKPDPTDTKPPSTDTKPPQTNSKPAEKRRQPAPVSSQPPSKKARQTGIMASFARQKTAQEEAKNRHLRCPICGRVFDASTSNADVNHHIDNCLID